MITVCFSLWFPYICAHYETKSKTKFMPLNVISESHNRGKWKRKSHGWGGGGLVYIMSTHNAQPDDFQIYPNQDSPL